MDINYYKQYEPIFGVWHITRLIGEGSFGKVFEIEREDFGQVYKAALKAITIPASQSEVRSVRSEGMDEESVRATFHSKVQELVKEFAEKWKIPVLGDIPRENLFQQCEDECKTIIEGAPECEAAKRIREVARICLEG